MKGDDRVPLRTAVGHSSTLTYTMTERLNRLARASFADERIRANWDDAPAPVFAALQSLAEQHPKPVTYFLAAVEGQEQGRSMADIAREHGVHRSQVTRACQFVRTHVQCCIDAIATTEP
jgi:hypothetical protein